ncbi:MAG: hypothetical protein HGA19_08515 [Oscillochloris sp.]|nr:hypothetical protein [Oscillochloris sp.]
MERRKLMIAHPPHLPLLVAYDRERAYELLRSSTAQSLRDVLRSGHFGAELSAADRSELDELLTAWVQRALGGVFLRDALIVDGRRGPRVFSLICVGLTRVRVLLARDALAGLQLYDPGDLQPTAVSALVVKNPALAELAEQAEREGLTLALLDQPANYPLPADLDTLLPLSNSAQVFVNERFTPPTGARRNVSIALALGGTALMIVPLLGGSIPSRPAGLPLALITLALVVGIRAGWSGYIGSFCIWLVSNLPGFRHDTSLLALISTLPLLLIGVVLLIFDRRVRALWLWVRQQIGR